MPLISTSDSLSAHVNPAQPITAKPHPFHHLGPAPYRFLGAETAEDREVRIRQASGALLPMDGQAPNLCAGSCDHCGTAIFDVYRFEAADGTRFKVGSTCQEKAHSELGHRVDTALLKGAEARREVARTKRHAREAAKLAEADSWIRDHQDKLRALPHPYGFGGQSFLDSLFWTWDNAGTAGKLRAYKAATKAVA